MRFLKLVGLSIMVLFTVNSYGIEPLKNKLSDLNRRSKMPVGINIYAVGPIGGLSFSTDVFITPKIAFEAMAGVRDFELNHAFSLGARYHFFGKTFMNMTPYIGIYTVFNHNGSSLQNQGLYIPIGIHRIKRNQWCWSVEGAFQRTNFFTSNFSLGIKLGYRFKTKK